MSSDLSLFSPILTNICVYVRVCIIPVYRDVHVCMGTVVFLFANGVQRTILASGCNNLITRTGSLDSLELKKDAMKNFLQILVFCLSASPPHREPAHTIIPGMLYMVSENQTDVRLLA